MALVVTAAWAALGAPAPDAAPPPQPAVGAEQFFALTWQPAVWRGRPSVAGYIVNSYGLGAVNVRLLVEHLDANGAVVAWTIGRVPDLVPSGSRVYFEVVVPAAAPAYRVSVLAYEWRFGPSGSHAPGGAAVHAAAEGRRR